MVLFQNKCTRYWPDVDTTKDVGPYHVKHMKETEFTDYTLREFEIISETNVSATTKILHMLVLPFFYDMKNAKFALFWRTTWSTQLFPKTIFTVSLV